MISLRSWGRCWPTSWADWLYSVSWAACRRADWFVVERYSAMLAASSRRLWRRLRVVIASSAVLLVKFNSSPNCSNRYPGDIMYENNLNLTGGMHTQLIQTNHCHGSPTRGLSSSSPAYPRMELIKPRLPSSGVHQAPPTLEWISSSPAYPRVELIKPRLPSNGVHQAPPTIEWSPSSPAYPRMESIKPRLPSSGAHQAPPTLEWSPSSPAYHRMESIKPRLPSNGVHQAPPTLEWSSSSPAYHRMESIKPRLPSNGVHQAPPTLEWSPSSPAYPRVESIKPRLLSSGVHQAPSTIGLSPSSHRRIQGGVWGHVPPPLPPPPPPPRQWGCALTTWLCMLNSSAGAKVNQVQAVAHNKTF